MLFVFTENDEDLRDKFDIFKRRRKEHSTTTTTTTV